MAAPLLLRRRLVTSVRFNASGLALRWRFLPWEPLLPSRLMSLSRWGGAPWLPGWGAGLGCSRPRGPGWPGIRSGRGLTVLWSLSPLSWVPSLSFTLLAPVALLLRLNPASSTPLGGCLLQAPPFSPNSLWQLRNWQDPATQRVNGYLSRNNPNFSKGEVCNGGCDCKRSKQTSPLYQCEGCCWEMLPITFYPPVTPELEALKASVKMQFSYLIGITAIINMNFVSQTIISRGIYSFLPVLPCPAPRDA